MARANVGSANTVLGTVGSANAALGTVGSANATLETVGSANAAPETVGSANAVPAIRRPVGLRVPMRWVLGLQPVALPWSVARRDQLSFVALRLARLRCPVQARAPEVRPVALPAPPPFARPFAARKRVARPR